MKLIVGCPVSHREWILDEWNQHVLSAVYALDEDVDLSYCFLASDKDLGTVEKLVDFDTYSDVIISSEDEREDRRTWSQSRYEDMVYYRNALLERIRFLKPDFFLSFDSDILLHPEALKSAFTAFRDEVWAVGLRTYMTERSTSHPSMGIWVDQQHRRYYRVDSRDITSCDIIMAAKLMKPEAYNVDYKLHTYGEDMGWSLGVTEAGGKLCYDGRVANKHVMVREQLNFVDERVGF